VKEGQNPGTCISHGETYEEYMIKEHLMEAVNKGRPKYDKPKIDEMAK
jgi:hypothetical protein